MQKILLLSVSAGAGHVRAAQALGAYAEQMEEIETLHLDVMDYVPKTFRKIYIDTYIKLVTRFPAAWGMIYKLTDHAQPDKLLQKLRRIVERLNTRTLKKAIAAFAPDVVICTHFLPAEILMHEINKGHFNIPVWVQVTDFDLHHMWVIPHMQGYFVGSKEVAFRLQQNGILAKQIHLTGIPIMPAFANKPDRKTYQKQYGLSTDRPVLLLMGGGAGLGGLNEVAEELLSIQDQNFQLIVLAGKNENALNSLQQTAKNYPDRLFAFGFTQTVEQLMACADLIITKPGGLTNSECMAMGVPMIIHAPIPGQEEHNADYLLEQGVALKALDRVGLVYRVEYLMKTPEKLVDMQTHALRLANPLAAKKALDVIQKYAK